MILTNNISPLNMSLAMIYKPQQYNSCFFSRSFLPSFSGQSLRFHPHRSTLRLNKCHSNKWKHSMFIGTRPLLKDGILSLNGKEVITGVPENVFLTPATDSSAFLGASSTESSSRHVFKLGVIQ